MILPLCLVPLDMPNVAATPLLRTTQYPIYFCFSMMLLWKRLHNHKNIKHVTASIYWRLGRTPLVYLILSFVYQLFWSSPAVCLNIKFVRICGNLFRPTSLVKVHVCKLFKTRIVLYFLPEAISSWQ